MRSQARTTTVGTVVATKGVKLTTTELADIAKRLSTPTLMPPFEKNAENVFPSYFPVTFPLRPKMAVVEIG